CRRILVCEQDVEDAFQATFLTLARQAGAIRKPDSFACWLHGVACRLAQRARAEAARRADREAKALPLVGADPLTEATGRELGAVLDEDLACLPESCRAPLLLCSLQGLTRDEAARRLGWSLATLKRRLARGRELLRTRLSRRGLSLGAMLGAPLLLDGTRAATPPPGLVAAAIRAALASSAQGVTTRTSGPVPGTAQATVSGRLKPATLALVLGVLVGCGLAAIRSRPDSGEQGDPTPGVRRPATDRNSDPLPQGALA